MKKYLFPLILSFIACAFVSCDNDDDDLIDIKLLKGQWELVSQDSSERRCIYDFTTQNDNTWSWGSLITYYLFPTGNMIHEAAYSWSVSDPGNGDRVYLELTLQGLLDSADPWANTEYFIITRLRSTEMELRKNKVGDSKTTLKFARYMEK